MSDMQAYDIFRNNIYISKIDRIIEEAILKSNALMSEIPSHNILIKTFASNLGKNIFLHSKSDNDIVQNLKMTLGTMINSINEIAESKGFDPLVLEVDINLKNHMVDACDEK